MSQAEFISLLRHVQRFPISDEANYHVPAARVCETLANQNRSQQSDPFHPFTEFLTYRQAWENRPVAANDEEDDEGDESEWTLSPEEIRLMNSPNW